MIAGVHAFSLPGPLGDLFSSGVNAITKDAAQTVFDGFSTWLAKGAQDVIGAVVGLLQPAASDLGKVAQPDLGQGWFGQRMAVMLPVATLVVLPLVLVATIGAVLRQDSRRLARIWGVALPAAILGGFAAVSLTGEALKATDALCSAVSSGIGPGMLDALKRVGASLVALSSTSPFLAVVAACVAVVGALFIWLELLLRAAAIDLAVFFVPVALVGLVWPATAHWTKRHLELLAALILSKFVIVASLTLAADAVGQGSDAGSVMQGGAILLLAGFAPFVLLRLAPVVEAAAIGHLEGVARRPVHAATSAPSHPLFGMLMGAATGGGGGAAGAAAAGGGAGGGGGGGGAAAVPAGTVPDQPGGQLEADLAARTAGAGGGQASGGVGGGGRGGRAAAAGRRVATARRLAAARRVTGRGGRRPRTVPSGPSPPSPARRARRRRWSPAGSRRVRMEKVEPRRYRFHPLERRGVVLGLQPLQLAALGLGTVVAVGVARAVPSTGGFVLGALSLAGVAALALWPVRGQPPVTWLPVVTGWVTRRAHGPRLEDAPLVGHLRRSRARPAPPTGVDQDAGTGATRQAVARSRRRRPPRVPFPRPAGAERRVEQVAGRERRAKRSPPRRVPGVAGVELLAEPSRPGGERMAVLRDRHAGTWAAALRVKGRSFAMLDRSEKERRLAAWGSLLASVGRAGSPVHRLQWLETTVPGRSDELEDYLAEAGAAAGDDARESYAELIDGAGPATQDHDALIVLALRPRRSLRTTRSACEQLGREARLLVGQLRSAELFGARLLGPDELADVVHIAHDPGANRRRRRQPTSGLWPMATDEAWSAYRTDGTWHATFWVAEWPRVEVGPDFLTPLLLTGGCRRVALVAGAVDPRRAARRSGIGSDRRPGRRATAQASGLRGQRPARAGGGGGPAPGGGAGRRACRLPVLGLRHRHGHRAERTGGALHGDRAGRPAVPSGASAPVRPPGGSVRLDAAAGPRSGVKPPAAHRATTAHLQALYPFIAEAGLGGRGAYVGRDLFGGSFCYDPWDLYRRGVLTSPNLVVLGQIGRGKSTFVKSMLRRQQVFGRQAWVVDPKGEYGPLAEACGCHPLRVVPGGAIRLNPLDTPAGEPVEAARRRGELLCSLAAASLGRDLSPAERTATDLAVRAVGAGAVGAGGAAGGLAWLLRRRHCPPSWVRCWTRIRSRRHRCARTSPAWLRTAGRWRWSCADSWRGTWPACSTGPPRPVSTSAILSSCWTCPPCTPRRRWASS